ncbi:uncharacterized protein LOC113554176 [Rhopalosiphum maidis]|uniref:uncharacterized protein LOC113554176 n=1 Tax=Rhopalosiphum maidis TaxID=43146 RepID=UPI000F005CB2|nr:uncharacterized protein LOC113554176 [Rhopalosiphum maidis]
MNTLDDGDRESSSPLDFGVADVITTTIVYLTCTVAVYVLCTFVEDAVDEPAAQTPDGTGTPAAAPPSASVASETSVAGTGASGSATASRPPPTHAPTQSWPTPPDAGQPPAETGDTAQATVPEDMGREKRRR